MKKITLLTFAFFAALSMNAQIILTQNTDNVVTGANSVGCPGGDNNWARNFILADYAVDPAMDFIIGSGSFGVQTNAAVGTVTVTVYASDAGFPLSFTGGNVLGTEVVAVGTNIDASVVEFDFTTPIVVPAGTVAVAYAITVPLGNNFFIGGTIDETTEGYLQSTNCAVSSYVTPSSINFPEANFLMTLTEENDLGVSENPLAKNLSIFPNPTNGELNIKFSKNVGSTTVNVINLSGQTVLKATVDGLGTSTLGTSKLASGVYFAQIATDTENTTVKFIKN